MDLSQSLKVVCDFFWRKLSPFSIEILDLDSEDQGYGVQLLQWRCSMANIHLTVSEILILIVVIYDIEKEIVRQDHKV